MRPECDPAGSMAGFSDRGGSSAQKLQNKPVSEKDPGRYPPESKENDQDYKRQNACPRIEDDVRSHDASNRSAGPDGWFIRSQIEHDVSDRRRDPANEVKDQISKMAEIVLNVVAKDPEKPHVSDHVQPAAVQEHRGQNCRQGGAESVMTRARKRSFKVNRNDSKLEDECVQRAPSLRPDRKFEEEHKYVQANDEISHVWRAVTWLVVANRDHGRLLICVIGRLCICIASEHRARLSNRQSVSYSIRQS